MLMMAQRLQGSDLAMCLLISHFKRMSLQQEDVPEVDNMRYDILRVVRVATLESAILIINP